MENKADTETKNGLRILLRPYLVRGMRVELTRRN